MSANWGRVEFQTDFTPEGYAPELRQLAEAPALELRVPDCQHLVRDPARVTSSTGRVERHTSVISPWSSRARLGVHAIDRSARPRPVRRAFDVRADATANFPARPHG